MISFAISYLFFQKQRDAAAASLHARFSGRAKPLRTAGEVDDAEAEDRLVDEQPGHHRPHGPPEQGSLAEQPALAQGSSRP